MLFIPSLSITNDVPIITYVAMVGIGKVSADLKDFPLMIDLADMPPTFWSQVNSKGSNIRTYAPSGASFLPHYVDGADKTQSTGRLFVKKTLLTASNNAVIIKVLGMATPALDVNDPNGQNAVMVPNDNPSDAWLAAISDNTLSPATFYSISSI